MQIDPNEIPGIEAMGVENRKSLAEMHRADRLRGQRRAAADRAANSEGLRRQPASGHRIFHLGIFGDRRKNWESGWKRELRDSRSNSEIALVGPNCMGLYSPSIGLCNFPDEKVGDGGGDVCFISQSGTHTINFCLQAPTHGIR